MNLELNIKGISRERTYELLKREAYSSFVHARVKGRRRVDNVRIERKSIFVFEGGESGGKGGEF